MPSAFADIAFTPSVKAAQFRYGSRENNRGFEMADRQRDRLTEREVVFLAERDSFYQATVGQTGWPYVQHRGGPAGFLKVLDEGTIGFADFRGNVQYLSVGNLGANDRISLILMDYANRRRLKIWGRARIVDESEDAELIARLEVPSYRARVERGIVIRIEAFDWNCPQHITPRFSESEVEQILAPLLEENKALKLPTQAILGDTMKVLGDGPLELVISGIRQVTPRIRSFELRDPHGNDLPPFEAGAHLRVPVILGNAQAAIRHYSISSDPARRDVYEIAVLHEENGRGGSRFVHQVLRLGMRLRCNPPRNDFKLRPNASYTVLIAGGIGVTPIMAMVHALRRQGKPFHLHYAARSAPEMAFRGGLVADLGNHLTTYFSEQHSRMAVREVINAAPANSEFYVCGPTRLVDDAVASATALQILLDRMHTERFSAPQGLPNQPIDAELKRSKKIVRVNADQTILDAAQASGLDALADCRIGSCGTCSVKVLEGTPEHRDSALTDSERVRAQLMCICVSRAESKRLVLDL